ncbi:MAG: S24 family peptidase [Paracoccus sp. (in: a-proteobacteria)]|uniref:S24 family peptidase n=1 Tax=Paracoccus sp. TaxID=267 RepID=UPI0026E08E68|nr:S24 family peptidase [Paracoccus sp. (in: a-proteobacteria)]MDO5622567.1 S24 family peptidase [Paracoccus sp. (in: a-proteobacteria)]
MSVLETLLAQVEARRTDLGLTQAQLGERAFGRPDTSIIQNMRRGSEPTYSKLLALCDALGLEFYIGPPRDLAPPVSVEIDGEEYDAVRRYDAQFSAGGGALNAEELEAGAVAFRRDWLTREGISARESMVVSVQGDSMAPTLDDGDLVLIDKRRRSPRGRRIYALVGPDGDARVKRIEVLADTMILHSDNDAYPTELVPTADADRYTILGEVVWRGHSLRDGGV